MLESSLIDTSPHLLLVLIQHTRVTRTDNQDTTEVAAFAVARVLELILAGTLNILPDGWRKEARESPGENERYLNQAVKNEVKQRKELFFNIHEETTHGLIHLAILVEKDFAAGKVLREALQVLVLVHDAHQAWVNAFRSQARNQRGQARRFLATH